MSDHLPECFVVVMAEHDWHLCICPALRACERRVREHDKNTFLRAAYDHGREDGVQAARDAVAAMDLPPEGPAAGLRAEALAAIDAVEAHNT